jgi:NTE family protein
MLKRKTPQKFLSQRRPTILVCSGGGVYGSAQAGMLLELAHAGFVPDVIVGVSAGAMNAVFLSNQFDAEQAGRLVEIWSTLDRRTIFPSRSVSQAWQVLKGGDAIHSQSGLRAIVERFSPNIYLEDSTIPVHIGAVAVNSGLLNWWDEGSVIERLCASASIPGVIPPVEIDGEMFFDGGVVANVPLQRAVDLGAARIIVVDVSLSTFSSRPSSPLDALLRAFSHSRTALSDHCYKLVPDDILLYRISGVLPDVDGSDFDRGPELVAAGRVIAREAIQNHPEMIKPLSSHKSFTLFSFFSDKN